jgi:hypothetical protein
MDDDGFDLAREDDILLGTAHRECREKYVTEKFHASPPNGSRLSCRPR